MPKVQGKLIAIEGLDGAGSTTQTERLASWLKHRGYNAIPTKEPTNGPAGGLIHLVLVGRVEIDPKTLAMLFLADRMDHQYRRQSGLLELLQDPRTVIISDRYYLSSYAYQVLEPAIDIEWLRCIHSKCLTPALTIYLNVPPKECINRIGVNRGFHFELFEKTAQLEQVRKNYLQAIQQLRDLGENIQVVDGQGTPDQVETRIRIRVEPLLAPGNISPDEGRLIFDNNKALAAFRDLILRARLQIVHIRPIPHGYQIRVSDSGDVVIPVNFYGSGRILVQGVENDLKQAVRELAEEVARKIPGGIVTVSKATESNLFTQERLF